VNALRSVALRLNEVTDRLRRVPVITLMPHSRCNCRCIMCDIWRANRDGKTLSESDVNELVRDFRRLRVEWVVLSGGEALMHPNLWTLCRALKSLPVRITLLSTGLLLTRHAADIVENCDDVIVSLDGSPAVHDLIRNIPQAFGQLEEGVAALKRVRLSHPVSARCVIQRLNFHDLPNIVETAKTLRLDRVSFLCADVSSTAFNRPDGWGKARAADVALAPDEVERFAAVVDAMIADHTADFASGFIAEAPEKLRSFVSYFRAVNGNGVFPPVRCNAPWVSAVIEADGTVRPCFFHAALGNIHERGLEEILNSADAVRFRRSLDIRRNPICRRCVCTFSMT